jgi:hypothetical protein
VQPESHPFYLSPRSARGRRRLKWVGAAVGLAGVAGLVIALVPAHSGKTVQRFTNRPVQRVHAEKDIALSAADRKAISTLLTKFTIDVIERKHPATGLVLGGPPLLRGTTRAEWIKGTDIPVYPYDAQGTDFSHSWRLDGAYPSHLDVELDLQPSSASRIGPVAFSVVLRQRGGRWQVDSIYPQAIYPK